MRRVFRAALIGWLFAAFAGLAERINHEGRILGPLSAVTAPVLFNTPEADAVVSAMQVFPVTNPWNEDISRRPVQANSDAMIAQIMADLRSAAHRAPKLGRRIQAVSGALGPLGGARPHARAISGRMGMSVFGADSRTAGQLDSRRLCEAGAGRAGEPSPRIGAKLDRFRRLWSLARAFRTHPGPRKGLSPPANRR
jgi:hypothetical protein